MFLRTQELLLDKHLNDTRFIYNQYVEEYLKAIKENRLPNYKDYQDLRAEHKFFKGSCAWMILSFILLLKKNKKQKNKQTFIKNFIIKL